MLSHIRSTDDSKTFKYTFKTRVVISTVSAYILKVYVTVNAF